MSLSAIRYEPSFATFSAADTTLSLPASATLVPSDSVSRPCLIALSRVMVRCAVVSAGA